MTFVSLWDAIDEIADRIAPPTINTSLTRDASFSSAGEAADGRDPEVGLLSRDGISSDAIFIAGTYLYQRSKAAETLLDKIDRCPPEAKPTWLEIPYQTGRAWATPNAASLGRERLETWIAVLHNWECSLFRWQWGEGPPPPNMLNPNFEFLGGIQSRGVALHVGFGRAELSQLLGDLPNREPAGLSTSEIEMLFEDCAGSGQWKQTVSGKIPSRLKDARISVVTGVRTEWDPVAVAEWLWNVRKVMLTTLDKVFERPILEEWVPRWKATRERLDGRVRRRRG